MVVSTLISVVCLCIGVFYYATMDSIAYAVLIGFCFNFVVSFYCLLTLAFKCSVFSFVLQVYEALLLSIIIAIVLYCISFIHIEQLIYSLFIKFAIFGLLYLIGLFSFGIIGFETKKLRLRL